MSCCNKENSCGEKTTRKDFGKNLYIQLRKSKEIYIENADVSWCIKNGETIIEEISWTEKIGNVERENILKIFPGCNLFPEGFWNISRSCIECGDMSCRYAHRQSNHSFIPKITIVNNTQ